MNQSIFHSRTEPQAVWIALFAASMVLGVFICERVMSYTSEPAAAKSRIQQMVSLSTPKPDNPKPRVDPSKAVVDRLKKKNLFVVTPPKQHPVSGVSGIIGNEALISGKLYKVGDKIGDAKIVAVEAAQVRIEWDGKVTSFSPMGAPPAEPPPPGPPKPAEPNRVEVAKVVVKEQPVVASAPVDDDPLAWMGVKLSPKAREMLLQMWNKIPDSEKQKAKDEWNKMSDAEKEKTVQMMENSPMMMSP